MEEYVFSPDEATGIDRVLCRNTRSSFSFTRKGAELFSYRLFDERRGAAVGLLYRDGDLSTPESGWKNHATVLFPVVGRLKNNESRLGVRRIRFDRNHGFARSTRFELAAHGTRDGTAFLVYSMRSDEETRRHYPFEFVFEVVYEIDSANLAVVFRVANPSADEDLYFSCGWHPGFSITDSRFALTFSGDHFSSFPVSGDGLLTGEKREISKAELEKAATQNLDRALVLGIPERSDRQCELVDLERGVLVGLSFGDFEFLGLWREGRMPFICVEPWQGTDDFEEQTSFDEKLGIVRLALGQKRSLRIEVKPVLFQ